MKIINLYSGPSGGKSTIAAGVFYHLKVRGTRVELVTEFAKDLGYDGVMDDMKHQQPYIFTEQNRRQYRLRGKVDYAITDSPTIMGLVYGKETGELSTAFCEFALDTYRSYDNINIFLRRNHEYQTFGRYHSEIAAEAIDEDILDMLKDNHLPYNTILIGPNTVQDVLEIIDSLA